MSTDVISCVALEHKAVHTCSSQWAKEANLANDKWISTEPRAGETQEDKAGWDFRKLVRPSDQCFSAIRFQCMFFCCALLCKVCLGETHRKSYAFDIDPAVSRYKSSDQMHDSPWSFPHAVNRLLHRGHIYMSTK